MDYPCAKFGDFSFSRLGFIVRTDRITEADDRYTHATTVGVRKNWTGVMTGAALTITLESMLRFTQCSAFVTEPEIKPEVLFLGKIC